ncbi:hypothetical protein ABZP36_001228 [Zizania latifolia]
MSSMGEPNIGPLSISPKEKLTGRPPWQSDVGEEFLEDRPDISCGKLGVRPKQQGANNVVILKKGKKVASTSVTITKKRTTDFKADESGKDVEMEEQEAVIYEINGALIPITHTGLADSNMNVEVEPNTNKKDQSLIDKANELVEEIQAGDREEEKKKKKKQLPLRIV